jgi:hypothetical protein
MSRVRWVVGVVAIVVGTAEAVPYTNVVGHRFSGAGAVEAYPIAPAASSLSQLRGVDELKSWFNAYKGHPRLIFLVSPT